jgi:hypothetical protein
MCILLLVDLLFIVRDRDPKYLRFFIKRKIRNKKIEKYPSRSLSTAALSLPLIFLLPGLICSQRCVLQSKKKSRLYLILSLPRDVFSSPVFLPSCSSSHPWSLPWRAPPSVRFSLSRGPLSSPARCPISLLLRLSARKAPLPRPSARPARHGCALSPSESRLEGGGVNRANLKFTNLITTTSRVSIRNINESERGRENKSQANKE